jgi:hypothetical protein
VGEPRVDLQHLLEDLRDGYTGSLEETILTEMTAAALDAGATRIRLCADPSAATLTVLDDGRGMKRRDLAKCHNLAAGSKARSDGIGFAGVGIRLGLLVADEILTETRRASTHVATTWHLATRYRAPWKWIPPPGLAGERGTAVRLRLSNPLSPLLDPGYVEEAIRTHFASLLDPAFTDLLVRQYSHRVIFEVDGQPLTPGRPLIRDRVTIPIRLGRKRLPSAIATMQRHQHPLPEDQQGIAVSTSGKVIKRGWDWLGLSPASAWRVTGLVEAPDLAACLTLGKNDFIRTGPRAAEYLVYRKAIQQVVSRQLTLWGDSHEGDARQRTLRLERDLERVLEDLEEDFPPLRALVDHGPSGQERLFAGIGPEDVEGTREPGDGTAVGYRRPPRHALLVRFESRPEDRELGRLVGHTIWINDAHPAYARAAASRSAGYHIALAVAMSLAPLAVDASAERAFMTRFLAQWGDAIPAPRRSSGKRRPDR